MIIAVLIATSLPLNSRGAISERYRGTTYAAIPTPIPTRTLPTMSQGIVGAQAMTIAPRVNMKSAKMITFLRPIMSDTVPEKSDPMAAPIRARETTKDR